jgi:methylmalonyl-CoA mutase cobalamin-binding domain/chain
MEKIINALLSSIDDGDMEQAVGVAKEALANGVDPVDLFQNGLVPVMTTIGERFSRLEIYLPDLIFAADVAKAIKDEVQEVIMSSQNSGPGTYVGKVVIGSVFGDVHDIGKNMVSTLLEVNGFEVVDVGVNVPVQTFINSAEKENADIIAMSSLLTTSMPYMAELIKTLEGLGKREKFKIVVGGGPVSEEWAESIGADGYGHDAQDAVDICKKLLS